jgi:hypothetical protein
LQWRDVHSSIETFNFSGHSETYFVMGKNSKKAEVAAGAVELVKKRKRDKVDATAESSKESFSLLSAAKDAELEDVFSKAVSLVASTRCRRLTLYSLLSLFRLLLSCAPDQPLR